MQELHVYPVCWLGEKTHVILTELYPVSIHLLQSTLVVNSLRILAVRRIGERGRGQARLMEDRKERKERKEGRGEMADVGCEREGDYKFTMGECW